MKNDQKEQLHHAFTDWLWVEDEKTGWLGKRRESWITFEAWSKARFRDWAMMAGIHRRSWGPIYRKYMKHYGRIVPEVEPGISMYKLERLRALGKITFPSEEFIADAAKLKP